MLFPHHNHLFNGHILRLRQEEVDKRGHHTHKEREEDEQTELQMTQQSQENLRDYECEDHVD